MKKLFIILSFAILFVPYTVFGEDEAITDIPGSPSENETSQNTSASIKYQTHIQNIGWQKYVDNGSTAGTTGKALRMEALKIKLDTNLQGNIEYRTHIQNIGWQNYVKEGATAGTTGKALRVEALKIRLVGEIEQYYDIYYRVHIEDLGWLPWAKNDMPAGSEGISKRVEAVEIKLASKNDNTIIVDNGSFIKKYETLKYQTHVQNIGWQNYVKEGATAGTTGKALQVEAFNIDLSSSLEGNVTYQSFIERGSWESQPITNGSISGTTGKSKAIQLIKINLTGELANTYDIYYRAHSSTYGWLGWAKNGEIAGVNHYSIEAIQIKLYFKFDQNKNRLKTKNHYIEQVNYKPAYYSQRDSRWKNKAYGRYTMGPTGCGPTAMAMALSGILNKSILPTNVADYLWKYTNDFNKRLAGTSGGGIIHVANRYDVKRTALKNKTELINALKKGKIIYAAMGKGKFVKNSGTHAIVLFGYNSNNTTNAYDPYDQKKNGAVSINLIWNEKSKDPDDYSEGTVFHSLERY
ncbi:MAG: C39 family peptidase [Romboutsia sp.]|nr:C39 family peptidase [Romboutsia sp.]